VTLQAADPKNKLSKAKVVTDGQRVVHTTREGAFQAKNRIGLPKAIAPEWSELVEHARLAYGDASLQLDALRAEIEAGLLLIRSEDRRERARARYEKYRASVLALVEIKARIQQVLAEQDRELPGADAAAS